VDGFGNAGLEHDLGDAVTVAQVGEDDSAMVAAAVDPAHEKGALPGVTGAKLSAGVGAAEVAEEVEL
jgi:hypothetical protein